MVAVIETLKILEDGSLINKLNSQGDKIRVELDKIFEANSIDAQTTGVGSLFFTHFVSEQVRSALSAARGDKKRLAAYHLHLLTNGIFILPTHEAVLSTAHSEADLEKLVLMTEEYAKHLKAGQ
jgi:glutamate-1-semialdehyde aminotransferase